MSTNEDREKIRKKLLKKKKKMIAFPQRDHF